MSADTPISSAQFRRQLSDAPDAEWSRNQKLATARAQDNSPVGTRDPEPIAAVWSENAPFGWLTWGVSSATPSQGPGAELVAIGLIDHTWATGEIRRKSARAHAERCRRDRPGRPGWWNTQLILATAVALLFLGIALSAGITGAGSVSIGVLLGIFTYNFPGIARRWSRKHVRVFADTALATTRNDLYALLSPVSAIARISRALRTAAVSPADQNIVDDALEEALDAVWQATDPTSNRTEVAAVTGKLQLMATAAAGILRSVADVDSATYMPIGAAAEADTADTPVDLGHASASRRVLSRLDATTQAIADHISAQEGAAEALRQINQPNPPTDESNDKSK